MCIWILDNLMHVRILNEHFVLLDVNVVNKIIVVVIVIQVTNWLCTLHDVWNQGFAVIENNESKKDGSLSQK